MGAALPVAARLLPQSARPLKVVMLERLIDGGTWMTGDELAAGLSSSRLVIEETLADLVIEGKADWREGSGYRLAGTVLARKAAKTLRLGKLRRAVHGEAFKGMYRVGVAEQKDLGTGDVALVMYELAMPMPPEGPDHLGAHMRQVQAVIDFVQKEA